MPASSQHRIALLTGGSTPERDVAFAGAAQVAAALRSRGDRVTVVDTVDGVFSAADEERVFAAGIHRDPPTAAELAALAARELKAGLVELPAVAEADLIFLVLHGRQGEGGEIQALLELTGIPYTGSGPLGSGMAMDKEISKRLFRLAAVPTPDWVMWPAETEEAKRLGYPLIVKPLNAGSTVGLSVVHSPDELERAVAEALVVDSEVMLEAYLPGREFTVGVLGERALAVGEIVPQHEIFDYECKYTQGMSREIFPAEIPASLAREMQELALVAHRALKLRDFSRIDFRLGADGQPSCLEANTLPGMTRMSLLPQAAAATGIDFVELCEEICRLALARSQPSAHRRGTD